MQIYADGKDVTQTLGGLSWKNSIDEVSTTMSFSIAKDLSDQWTATYLPKHGSIVSYITNTEVFRGIILAVDDGDLMLNSYTVADFGFYLKKNKDPKSYTIDGNPSDQSGDLKRGCGIHAPTLNRIRMNENNVTGTAEADIIDNEPSYPHLLEAQDRLQPQHYRVL